MQWVREINQNVDELWVPSEFVRGVFITGGVSPRKLRVIPYGVDDEVFRPEGSRWRPEGSRGFAFLFVGGVIERKGLDLLAEAYEAAFRPKRRRHAHHQRPGFVHFLPALETAETLPANGQELTQTARNRDNEGNGRRTTRSALPRLRRLCAAVSRRGIRNAAGRGSSLRETCDYHGARTGTRVLSRIRELFHRSYGGADARAPKSSWPACERVHVV